VILGPSRKLEEYQDVAEKVIAWVKKKQ
jgi:hypothetical protein